MQLIVSVQNYTKDSPKNNYERIYEKDTETN